MEDGGEIINPHLNLSDQVRGLVVDKIAEFMLRFVEPIVVRVIAARFEKKMYAAATSQDNYVRNIARKLLAFEHSRRLDQNLPVLHDPLAPRTPPLSPVRRLYDDNDDNDDEEETNYESSG